MSEIAVDSVNSEQLAVDKTAATKAFNALNYFGLGLVGNSGLSLFLTYNILPTKVGQATKDIVGKIISPVVSVYQKSKGLISKSAVNAVVDEVKLAEQARSTAEVLCMTIAGSAMLLPMKWMENHKTGVVDRIDRLMHPATYRNMTPEQHKALLQQDASDERQSWGKLIKSRVVALGAVISLDTGMQAWNNRRHAQKKLNFDTYEWDVGGKIYEHLPIRVRDGIINFFSSKKAGIDSLQHDVQSRIANIVGHDANKMVFAEQTRLFVKEVSLTAILATIVMAFAKTGKAHKHVPLAASLIKQDDVVAQSPIAASLPEPAIDLSPIDIKPAVLEKSSDSKGFADRYAAKNKVRMPISFTERAAAAGNVGVQL